MTNQQTAAAGAFASGRVVELIGNAPPDYQTWTSTLFAPSDDRVAEEILRCTGRKARELTCWPCKDRGVMEVRETTEIGKGVMLASITMALGDMRGVAEALKAIARLEP